MYAGLTLTALAATVPYLSGPSRLLADHIRAGYPTYSGAEVDSVVDTYLVLLTVVGVLGTLTWLGSAWAVRGSRRWSRAVTTGGFLLGASVGLTALLTKDTSGDTGLPVELGLLTLAPALAGLVAVGLLWMPQRRAVVRAG